jgi:ABC-2 type transport system permease protein
VSEVFRYEGRQRFRGATLVTVGFVLISALFVGLYPSVEESGIDYERFLESSPEALQAAVGSGGVDTVEGFLAIEFYQFVWLLLFGVYVAYSGGALVASDVEHGRMDVLLATPVHRSRILVEKYLSLLVPVLLPNLVLPLAVYGAVAAVGESLSLVDLYAVHLLSVPYLLCCASIGTALSVLVDRAAVAQRGGLVAVFALFLVEAISTSADLDALGAVSPTRYYDPSEVLVEGTYDVAGAAVLLCGALVLLTASVLYFEGRDVG